MDNGNVVDNIFILGNNIGKLSAISLQLSGQLLKAECYFQTKWGMREHFRLLEV
jgi:hypothetical protein